MEHRLYTNDQTHLMMRKALRRKEVCMNVRFLSITLALLSAPAFAQTPDLAGYHSILTVDCRNIRGHAARIVGEASEATLNKDVAEAHLAEVAKYHDQMETTLRDSKKALSARQLKAVKVEYASLEKICTNVGKLVERLQAEFSKDKPRQLTIRELASELRNEMTSGYRLHEIMKKKLGLR